MLPPLILSSSRELGVLAATIFTFVLLRAFNGRKGSSSRDLTPSLGLLVGATTPLLAWVGPSFTLLLSAIFTLSISQRRSAYRSLMWASPLLAYLITSTISEVLLASPFLLTITVDSLQRLHDIALALVSTQAPSWMYLSRVTIFALMVGALAENERQRISYAKGALAGSSAAGVCAVLSYFGVFALPPQTELWTLLNRISGTMSDPNALGVIMGLALWLSVLLRDYRTAPLWRTILLLSPIVAGGLVAGSRTFTLAVGLLVLTLTWRFSRALTASVVGLGILTTLAISILDAYTPTIQTIVANQAVPETLRRTVTSLSFSRAEESLFSRAVFLSISSRMIEDSPLFGVGADRYRGYVGLFAQQLNLPIGSWTDNSNNFYLGVIAELGVVGALAYLLCGYRRRLREHSVEPLAPASLIAILLLFITGPHTDFSEVLALVALLIALTTTSREISPPAQVRTMTIFLALGCFAPILRETGTFNWHREIDSLSRWLSPHARVSLSCVPSEQGRVASITLQPEYIPSREPLHVSIRDNASEIIIDFTKRGEQHVTIPCDSEEKFLSVSIDTRPPWSPYRAWPGTNNDHRLMGVQQLIRLSSESINVQP